MVPINNGFLHFKLGTNIIRTAFPSFVTFSANWMMVVTWEEVAAYGCSDTGTITYQQRNTFQLVLITNGVHSFVEFNYNKITWTKFTQLGSMLAMEHIITLFLGSRQTAC